MAGLYERHDRDKFEIIALDCGRDDGSEMRARLKNAFDRWIDIKLCRTRTRRPPSATPGSIFWCASTAISASPAWGCSRNGPRPVQVNYLGFPATLGAPYIDYILADKIVIPSAEQRFYDEQVVYLPGCYQANDDKGRPMAADTQPRRSRIA